MRRRVDMVVLSTVHTPYDICRAPAITIAVWCLFEAWHTGKKDGGVLVLLSHGVDFQKMEQVGWMRGWGLIDALLLMSTSQKKRRAMAMPASSCKPRRCSTTWTFPRQRRPSPKTATASSSRSTTHAACSK